MTINYYLINSLVDATPTPRASLSNSVMLSNKHIKLYIYIYI